MTTPFPHDFSAPSYCKALGELFKAGTGVAPPTLAGRGDEIAIAQKLLLGLLADGNAPAGDLVLFGPRGNGKTVLLKKLERRALKAQIGVLSLTPDDIDSPTSLLRALLQAPPNLPDSATPTFLARFETKFKEAASARGLSLEQITLDGPGLSTTWRAVPDETLRAQAKGYLSARCGTQPLLVTVDEAHTLDIEVGRRLLNLSQQLRASEVPFVLILAGTPQLEAHLGEMSATFWDRSEILPIGRLDAEATRQALTEPLSDWSVTIEPAALEAVVADSQRYPYFIQLWGRALCEGLIEAGHGHTVTLDLVEQVTKRVAAHRERYYGKRYLELEKQGLLEAAASVADAFEDAARAHKETLKAAEAVGDAFEDDGTTRVHKAMLKAALREDPGLDAKAAEAALEQLADVGYTWAPAGGRKIEPGIPSLMTHVREALAEEMDATPARRALSAPVS